MTPAGYSGTPLAKKLGITANTRVLLKHAPSEYDALVAPLPIGVVFDRRLTAGTDIVHLFVDRAAVMAKELQPLRETIRADAVIWVSWPKKSSKVPADIATSGRG